MTAARHPAEGQPGDPCPECGHRGGLYQHVDAEGADVRVMLHCRACGAAWADGERERRCRG